MKRLLQSSFMLSLALLFTVSLAAFAQTDHESHHPKAESSESEVSADKPAEGGGMMQGMMGGKGMMEKMHGQGGMMQGMMGGKGMMSGGMMGMCPMCSMMMEHMKGGMMQGMMGGKGMMEKMHGQGSMMQGMMGGKGMMSGGMMGMHGKKDAPLAAQLLKQADKLELTDDQRAQLREIAANLKKTLIEQRAIRETAQVDLDSLLAEEDSSLDAIEQQLKAISQTEVTSRLAQLKANREAKSLLTAEQLEKFQQKSEVKAMHKARQGSDTKQKMHGRDK